MCEVVQLSTQKDMIFWQKIRNKFHTINKIDQIKIQLNGWMIKNKWGNFNE